MVPASSPTRSLAVASWSWRVTPVAVLAMAVLCAAMLALPGQTETTKYVNDLLIFLDGAYRVSAGQVPNRDFHTALGPLAYYIPAAGYWLTGSLGAALPVGTALVILLVAPAMACILDSRLRPLVAVPFAAFLCLILAAPINLGESPTALSYGMFYNRLGWAILALLLILYLPPRREYRRQALLDALCATLLVVLLLYMKISYGLVALAFLFAMLVIARQRLWAALAIAGTLAVGLVVEAFWRSTGAHFADLRLAAEVSGALRGSTADRVRLLLANIPDLTLFALLAGLSLWRTRSLGDLLFYGFCALGGYLILNQNFQTTGVITLFAAGAVATEALLRPVTAGQGGPKRPLGFAALLLLAAFLLPGILHAATALTIHTVAATRRAGVDLALPNFEGVRLVNVWSGSEHFFFSNYINTLRNGARALAEFVDDPGQVFVLDFVSPFSAGLGLEPPRGDSSWQHWRRTFDAEHFIPPEELLNGVRVVLEPKYPIERWTYDGLRNLYLPYIRANYDLVGENVDWWVFVARQQPRAAQ